MIETIYKNRKDFIVIGLTGRIGSGCTTTAEFLSQEIKEHKLRKICINDYSTDRKRKRYIIDKFYRQNWKPFKIIKASDIITTFLLKYDFNKLNDILTDFNSKVQEAKSSKEDESQEKKKILNRFKNYDEIITLDQDFEEYYNKAHNNFKNLHNKLKEEKDESLEMIYKLITEELVEISKEITEKLSKKSYKNYTDIFQFAGDNIRLYGDIEIKENSKNAENIYTISEYINLFIKKIRKYNKKKEEPTLIAIDAIRNPLEGIFFKERYSGFYLFAINSKDEDIEDRILYKNNMTKESIKNQSNKENQNKILESLENFVSQDIQSCIASSDIFIVNNGKYGSDNYLELYGNY